MKKRLPKSIRKYIRGEKARIRREVFDASVEKDLIRELYERFLPKKKGTSEEVPQDQQQREKKEHKVATSKKETGGGEEKTKDSFQNANEVETQVFIPSEKGYQEKGIRERVTH